MLSTIATVYLAFFLIKNLDFSRTLTRANTNKKPREDHPVLCVGSRQV